MLHVTTAVTQRLAESSTGSLDLASLVRGDTFSHLLEKNSLGPHRTYFKYRFK